ncbi:uncharacterized protein [Amphiura filiformis]|uniref:uncharacterized protein n=1 Tax=Amphiura filiformis TaxID=82378 RepID=UPI003B225A0A
MTSNMSNAVPLASPRNLPQSPQPFSVITEHWQNKLQIPSPGDQDKDLCSFGDVYEESLYRLIHTHLELDTHDRFAYVGASKGSLASKIKDKFCLMQPMVNIFPGLIHYEQTPNQRMLPFKIAHVGAEEYFRQLADDMTDDKEPPFDKILLKDSVEHFTHPAETFSHIMKTLTKFGRILIIHRPGPMATLPFFSEASRRFSDEDVDEPYIKIIKNLQAIKVDVKWEVETVPIVMPKTKWLAMLKEKFPPQMEVISNCQVQSGIRELTEGMLKYQGDMVEFYDRLLFVTATHPLVNCGYPSIQRCGASDAMPYPGVAGDMKYTLKVTPDLYAHVREMEQKVHDKDRILF